ncbi:MAG: hypothetical protein ACLPID_02920 [Beijerinckiaceae bacterium]
MQFIDEKLRDWSDVRTALPLYPSLKFVKGGLALGRGTHIARFAPGTKTRQSLDLDGHEARILALLAAAHDRHVSHRALETIRRAGEVWRTGDKALAQIRLVYIGLPPIDERGAYRLDLAAGLLDKGFSPRHLLKELGFQSTLRELEKYSPAQPRVPAGSGDESGRWTSGSGGSASAGTSTATASPDISDLAQDWSALTFAGTNTTTAAFKASHPIPVVLNDGTVVQNPDTKGPLLQPDAVSLTKNAQIGQVLSLLPSAFSIPPGEPIRETAMTALFFPGQPMDYQRIYGNDGQINRDYIDFGNYNYGVVAAAAGYSFDQALLAAGTANLLGSGDKSGPYFNSDRNLPFIKMGYGDYKAGSIGQPAR